MNRSIPLFVDKCANWLNGIGLKLRPSREDWSCRSLADSSWLLKQHSKFVFIISNTNHIETSIQWRLWNKKKLCWQILDQFYLRLKIPKITAQVVLKIDRLLWKISKQTKQVWFKKQNHNKNELLTHTFEHLNHANFRRICLISASKISIEIIVNFLSIFFSYTSFFKVQNTIKIHSIAMSLLT